jgi:hypothetical protein
MNEAEYKSLCLACDQLLITGNPRLSRIAIPWLHIIREHPVLIKNYIYFFNSSGQKKSFFLAILNNILIVLKGMIHIARSVFSSDYLITNTLGNRKVDFLFVSHILNEKQAGLSDDFYFGSVPTSLANRSKNVLIVLLNHSLVRTKILSRKWNGENVPRILLTKKITLAKSIQIYMQMLKTSFDLWKQSFYTLDGLNKRVAAKAAVEALSAGTFANMRLEWQIASIVKKYEPSNLIVTYEGHAYERMIFHAAHRTNPKIFCLGYQHSALFRLQHSFRRMLNEQFNFNALLTSSLYVKKKLLNESIMKGAQIEVLGSNRGIEVHQEKKFDNSNYCLVIPEGFFEECEVLFGYSLSIAKELPEMSFIWRLHPSISFEQLKAKNKLFQCLPLNIILSDKSLDDDIKRSSIALYRGTTAVVKAVPAGLLPVYLRASNNEMTIDPLYAIEKGKLVVGSTSDFIALFKSMYSIKIYREQTEEIRQFCKNFFDPFDINVFERLHGLSRLN